jgi:hypothetical protein
LRNKGQPKGELLIELTEVRDPAFRKLKKIKQNAKSRKSAMDQTRIMVQRFPEYRKPQ